MKNLLFIVAVALSFSLSAQELKSVTFDEPTHEFGTIKEVDGPAEFDFVFKNTGTDTIKILNVRASCGCTTPAWTKEEVAPGESGFIKAIYNPRNRPGPFHKTLTVTTSSVKNSTIILRVNGQVEPKPRTIEDDLPTLLGGIRVKYRAFNLGKVFNNSETTKGFDVYNASEKEIVFNKEVEGPAYIKVSFIPETLAPKAKGKISITYDGKAKNDLGFMSDNIVISTNEEGEDSVKGMSVYADINEYFPPMSADQKLNAPRIGVGKSIHNFGNINEGDVVVAIFLLTNTGKSNLNIRKVAASCSCTVPQLASNDIMPGKSVELKVTFNSTGRKGNQTKSVIIYTNDPAKPIQKVTLKAKIAVKIN